MQFKKKFLLSAVVSVVVSIAPAYADDEKEITLIHMGDIHGHLLPRANVRSDGTGRMEGGLARMKTKIDSIRHSRKHNLLINTGDTTQGSGEALYTRGKAMVDVLDLFEIDVFAPGNWDWVYGKGRFIEHFVDSTYPAATTASKRWGAIAANVYHAGVSPAATILPPTKFKMINGLKVGIIGCTTNRGPQVVGTWVSDGLTYTDCGDEVKVHAAAFRNPARPSTGAGDPGGAVDLVIMASEIELGRNIQLMKELTAETHVDIVFNSDMHEEVSKPIKVTTSAGLISLLVEQGMDGTALGEMRLEVVAKKAVGKKISEWKYIHHTIDDRLSENTKVKNKIAEVRMPYTQAGYTAPTVCDANSVYWNMFSETCLHGQLDAVVGVAGAALHRSNFSDEASPAVLEGSSHNWIADAMRWWAKSDAATIRGFRYGTTVKAGSKITRNDLFHFVPVGPRVAKVSRINAAQLRNQIDNSSRSVFGQDTNLDWRGGWMFGYSAEGFSLKFDPYSVSAVDANPTNGNPLYAVPPAGTPDQFAAVRKPSRARDLTVKVPCAQLPASEQSTNCVGSALTHITNNTNGDWTTSWNMAFATRTIYNLAPGNSTNPSMNWIHTEAPISKPFQAPVVSAAGYWYRRTPQTINNCENCFPSGSSNAKTLSNDTPYLLPVNADAVGNPALNPATGIPLVKVYKEGDVVPVGSVVGDWIPGADGKPQVEGRYIDLVEILEKYLTTAKANPVMGRVTLWNGATLPNHRATFGFPVMQPLCGTIGRAPAAACP